MNIIKLDATESTNSFLKELSVNSTISSYTVVVANKQTSGRGQMNTTWVSEANKNLLCSVYITFDDFPIHQQVYLNFAIAIAIHEALLTLKLPNLEIKWPNDILSDKKKICGILVENILKGNKIMASIVGIGVNVNQEKFPEDLPNASSIKNCVGKEVEIDEVLAHIIAQLKNKIALLESKKYVLLQKEYESILHKKNVPSMFKDTENVLFMGKILGVNTINGNLRIELADETIKEFGLKEVSFL
ncbi:biotin--[acetyl-CoA-carboxylase] ligase [Tenacibaculum agarivorans]|uniref:biotin--[acetyl-CoA-carboxylase] ligase n=1 Tax=Tenacibaculum agarivorans TaxID=1908389 RepID=UPI00094BBECC|nr:biotin--[acetyl-CoA-carboxylase] ligase [Tenacibaculum agarivorans]